MTKNILIIGAGPGIGLSTARTFLGQGFRAVIASRNSGKLARHADEMLGKSDAYSIQVVDAKEPTQIAQLVARTNADVLHYNAGVVRYNTDGTLKMTSLADFATEDITADIQVNLSSALVAIQAAMPGMKAKGGGTILLTGGSLATNPHSDLLTLSAGKAGLRASARALFEPLRALNIHVGLVTVSVLVSAGSDEAADVARACWDLHSQAKEDWSWETVYSGRNA
jgi:short-subunit dehydrogenase